MIICFPGLVVGRGEKGKEPLSGFVRISSHFSSEAVEPVGQNGSYSPISFTNMKGGEHNLQCTGRMFDGHLLIKPWE